MDQKKSRPQNIVDTEHCGESKKLIFLDMRLAKNQKHYLTITSLQQKNNNDVY